MLNNSEKIVRAAIGDTRARRSRTGWRGLNGSQTAAHHQPERHPMKKLLAISILAIGCMPAQATRRVNGPGRHMVKNIAMNVLWMPLCPPSKCCPDDQHCQILR